jgi:TPR repeat protein/membrane protease YdiL (CAAX protease family)
VRFILLISLGFWIATSVGVAETVEVDPGYLGIEIDRAPDSDLITILDVVADGPAAKAGVQAGDLITQINDTSTQGLSTKQALQFLRGEIGSVVKLTIRRAGAADESIAIVRQSAPDTFLSAALAGDPKAATNLGFFYQSGPASTRDLSKAVQWYQKAADQGYARAQADLGNLYEKGLGVPKDLAVAVSWYRKAADQGYARAQANLGYLYENGLGIPKDLVAAVDWYQKAANQGSAVAETNLGYLYEKGMGVSQDLKMAASWYRKAADQGYARAQNNLGYLYENGLGVGKDQTIALGWYQKAAVQDYGQAQAHLGRIYQYGLGVAKDQNVALTWYHQAADHGDAWAERQLGLCYLNGEGVTQNDRDAFAWFYSAASRGDVYSQENLGYLYREGRGVEQNDHEAFNWYSRSAQRGSAAGAWGLAYLYECGRGVKRNDQAALVWYKKAQVGFPQDKQLRREIIKLTIKLFLKRLAAASKINLAIIRMGLKIVLVWFCLSLAMIYIVSAVTLLYATYTTPDGSPRLLVALGWIGFYLGGQVVAGFGLGFFGKTYAMITLILLSLLFGALPVIASSLGPNRVHIWKASQVSWSSLLPYGLGVALLVVLMNAGFGEVYHLVTHSSLPLQSTQTMIVKAKHESVWLTYLAIVLVAPLAEEIIFRHYLFDALKRRFSGKVVVNVTALIFAAIHFDLLHFVALFGIGLALGWMKLKSGSLRLPVVLHMLNNGLVAAFIH